MKKVLILSSIMAISSFLFSQKLPKDFSMESVQQHLYSQERVDTLTWELYGYPECKTVHHVTYSYLTLSNEYFSVIKERGNLKGLAVEIQTYLIEIYKLGPNGSSLVLFGHYYDYHDGSQEVFVDTFNGPESINMVSEKERHRVNKILVRKLKKACYRK